MAIRRGAATGERTRVQRRCLRQAATAPGKQTHVLAGFFAAFFPGALVALRTVACTKRSETTLDTSSAMGAPEGMAIGRQAFQSERVFRL